MSGWLCAAAHINADWPPHSSAALTSAPASESSFARRPRYRCAPTTISAVSPSGVARVRIHAGLQQRRDHGRRADASPLPTAPTPRTRSAPRRPRRPRSAASPARRRPVGGPASAPSCRRARARSRRRRRRAASIAAARSPDSSASSSVRSAASARPRSPPARRERQSNVLHGLNLRQSRSLSPIDSTGICALSNSVNSKSENRESCGYRRCWPPLIRPCARPSTAAGSGSLLCRSLSLMLLPYRITE